MCMNPRPLPNGVSVGCRQCWQCRENRINDWVGRCVAEIKTSKAANSVTLTYGTDENPKKNIRAAVLTYSDVQKYFKRLRKSGFEFSYFVCGEYGSKNGRAHWHAVIFWRGDKVPEHKIRQNFIEKHWPHGWSFWDNTDQRAVRYVCKYLQKDRLTDGERLETQGYIAMSKKPALGAKFISMMAQQYVDQGLAPQNLRYSWPDITDKEGNPIKFHLHDRMADYFLEEYIIRWRRLPRRWGAQGPHKKPLRPWHYPASEIVEQFEDRHVRNWPDDGRLDAELLDKHRKGQIAWHEKQQDTIREQQQRLEQIPSAPPHIARQYGERHRSP